MKTLTTLARLVLMIAILALVAAGMGLFWQSPSFYSAIVRIDALNKENIRT
jgi:hypothetical protein